MSIRTPHAVAFAFVTSFSLTITCSMWLQHRWSPQILQPQIQTVRSEPASIASLLPNLYHRITSSTTPDENGTHAQSGARDNTSNNAPAEAQEPMEKVPAFISYSSHNEGGADAAILKNDSSDPLRVTVITHSHVTQSDSSLEVDLPGDGEVNLTSAGYHGVQGDKVTLRADNHVDVTLYPQH